MRNKWKIKNQAVCKPLFSNHVFEIKKKKFLPDMCIFEMDDHLVPSLQ